MITGLIITYNEEANIKRCLSSLSWLEHIIVIDSFSSDNTIDIINTFDNTTVFQRPFDDFATQCNFGITKCDTDWILSIDADYIFNKNIADEIQSITTSLYSSPLVSISAKFKYCIYGTEIKGSTLPPRKVLFNKNYCSYIQDGHAHKLISNGRNGKLQNYILHDDRKPLDRWLKSQDSYINKEVVLLQESSLSKISIKDKIRKYKFLAPFFIFIYCYFVKFGFLSGKRGLFYAFQRMYAELLLSIKLLDDDLNENTIKK